MLIRHDCRLQATTKANGSEDNILGCSLANRTACILRLAHKDFAIVAAITFGTLLRTLLILADYLVTIIT